MKTSRRWPSGRHEGGEDELECDFPDHRAAGRGYAGNRGCRAVHADIIAAAASSASGEGKSQYKQSNRDPVQYQIHVSLHDGYSRKY
jgi:hypothetical protein